MRRMIALAALLALPATAHAAERRLNGAEEAAVATIMRGGHSWGATPELKAIALARGGGNGAERARLATLRRGGSVHGATESERAAVLMTGGGNGAERSRIATLKRGGSIVGATRVERMAAGRGGRR